MSNPTPDYAGRIRKLLDTAENFAAQGNQETADSYLEKAQALMVQYSIDEAMVNDTVEKPDEVGQFMISFTGIYAQVEREITESIALANDCKIVVHNPAPWEKKNKVWSVTITGWRSDLVRIEMLNASAQLQCKSALMKWNRENRVDMKYLSAMDKFKNRRQFIASFSNGLYVKLTAARDVAKQNASVNRATETGESVQDASSGVELALRTRKESVEDWYDLHYSSAKLRTVHVRRDRGGNDAAASGWSAGRTADTGQTRVGGGARAIGG